jgi:uncharacterized metal-binding protein
VLDKAEVPVSCYAVVTDCGIEKGHHFNIAAAEVEAVCGAVRCGLTG